MKLSTFFTTLKPFAITYISIIAFSNFVFVLFSQTVRDYYLVVFQGCGRNSNNWSSVFICSSMVSSKQGHVKLQNNTHVVIFDIFGKESKIDGLRTEFKNHDVAWSFMKFYKKSYPLCNFAMVTKQKKFCQKNHFQIYLILLT